MYLLGYKSSNGKNTIHQITNNGYLDGHEWNCRPGWENMVVYYEGAQPSLLSRRPGEALVETITDSSIKKIQQAQQEVNIIFFIDM